MGILKFYKTPGLSAGKQRNKFNDVLKITDAVTHLETECCYYVDSVAVLTEDKLRILKWILTSPFDRTLNYISAFEEEENCIIIEIGPRLNFSTAFSSNAVSICKAIHLDKITRIEVATRYLLRFNRSIDKETENAIAEVLHDRMTECRYMEPIETFDHGFRPENWFEVDILSNGKKALESVNSKLGLAFDEWDLEFYTNLFATKLRRNPTTVECFDLAQSNSEHSRHWFFKGKMVIDGVEMEQSLIDMIIDTQNYSNSNNVIKFSDNSSAIQGYEVVLLRPKQTKQCEKFILKKVKQHLIFTAETHNFPTGVAPFSGATTGTGGRIRDIEAIGRGGYYIAGTAGYCVGNLLIPGYDLPWEEKGVPYPDNMAQPLDIIVEASNGASDYGNKFGEPVILGFARTFGGRDCTGARREWIKPIMFSGGIGTVDANMTQKLAPEKGMEVVKIGGPVYRIGVGGGSASSIEVQGDNNSELDFGAVQRGDPEMEQKLNRVIRACTEMGDRNPILSIHDQGAGGNGNVLKELVEPAGAVIFTRKFDLGDPSISTLELWGAEYQESNAFLCKKEDKNILTQIAAREKCPINFVGVVTGNGRIILSEDPRCDASIYLGTTEQNSRNPVDLKLELVLGNMPRKTFNLERQQVQPSIITLPQNLTVLSALERVLRLPSVASKRYLTNKVDRCVTGLIAQQQCVGPLHTPLSNVAVTAISYFSTVGIASSIGEQPIKGIVNPAAGARMTVAEALTNLVFAKISDLRDVKCSGNWMWAAKLPGEGAALYDACTAMCSLMREIGIAVDGGKDSLSMAARIGTEVVKAPGTLVISCYAPCPNIRQVVTPDLKAPLKRREGVLILVDLSQGKNRLGGTALSQVYNQNGGEVPDVESATLLKNAFNVIQNLIGDNKILAGHDISDGGLITCLLEMSFAGLSGIEISMSQKTGSPIEILFSEEIGWVLEVEKTDCTDIIESFEEYDVPAYAIGKSKHLGLDSNVTINVNDVTVLNSTVFSLMKIWEETSYQLELRQTNTNCALEEFDGLQDRMVPSYQLTFDPLLKPPQGFGPSNVRVAVIREEGINGDREMVAALMEAGFEVWDVTVRDLLTRNVTLDEFRGLIFPGGFSYADVLGSAKGWAATLRFHPSLRHQLIKFQFRPETFSLGVCNGCQLLSLLGWINVTDSMEPEIFLDQNVSERFECRWSTVRIERSHSIMLRAMDDSIFGVWVAHGEGRFTFKNPEILKSLNTKNCIAIRYTDDLGNPTEKYPMNPNGSTEGIAGICSYDGRHLAMMPHPERCTKMWQWPWKPDAWKNFEISPWQRMFENAYSWCTQEDEPF